MIPSRPTDEQRALFESFGFAADATADSQLAVWLGHDHADRFEVVVNAAWIPRDDADGTAASKVATVIVRQAMALQRTLTKEKFEGLFR